MISLLALVVAVHATISDPQRFESIEWADIWLPHSDESKFPRVLLIGDSITRAYYPEVEKRLEGTAYVGRLTTSAFVGDPMFSSEVAFVLKGMKFDVIHFNNGIHGPQHTQEEYRRGLQALVQELHRLAPKAKLIWAETTPTRDDPSDGSPRNPWVDERNQIATQVMKGAGIPIDDLHSPMAGHPEYHSDDFHFKDAAVQIQGAQVASIIKETLR